MNLSRANLEGASLVGANLSGARLSNARLVSADLSGANLSGAVLTHAELSDSLMDGANLTKANLTGATLTKASLEEADCTSTKFKDAVLVGINARGAKFIGASLIKADLRRADFSQANLSNADARYSVFAGATLTGACLTGACVGGMIGTGAPVLDVIADSIDTSMKKDGSGLVRDAEVASVLQEGGFPKAAPATVMAAIPTPAPTPAPPVAPQAGTRYLLGPEDVLKNAEFEFKQGGTIEIDGRCDECIFTIQEDTHLLVGKTGILIGCQVRGPGRVTILGAVIEEELKPGILDASELRVADGGLVASEVEQGDIPTRFAFNSGSRLRLSIRAAKNTNRSGGAK